jgi:hypothetical protein
VINNLWEKPERRFTWAEICYLKMFWDESHPEIRDKITLLIKEGRLEIVGGGWVQHDETLTSFKI